MAVEYKKSPLTEVMLELPKLFLQYQQQQRAMRFEERMLEDKQTHEEKLVRDKYEYDANRAAYTDAKAEYREEKKALDLLELNYRKTGADIGHLPDIYNTGGALKVLDSINKIPATELLKRAQHWEDKTTELETKQDRLSDVLFGDIAHAQQIMAGGAGPGGGFLQDEWDIEDFGVEAYETQYGDASELVKDLFRASPGVMQQSYMKTAGEAALMEAREAKVAALTDTSDAATLKRTVDVSNKWYGQRIKASKQLSGYNLVTGYGLTMATAKDNGDEETYNEAAQAQLQTQMQIGMFYGELIGEDEKTRAENALANYTEFENMHQLAKSVYKPGEGLVAPADFSLFQQLTDAAWTNYQKIDESTFEGQEYREHLDTIARALLGMTQEQTFEQFIQSNRKYYADNMLKDLIVNGKLNNDTDINISGLDWLDEFNFEEDE